MIVFFGCNPRDTAYRQRSQHVVDASEINRNMAFRYRVDIQLEFVHFAKHFEQMGGLMI